MIECYKGKENQTDEKFIFGPEKNEISTKNKKIAKVTHAMTAFQATTP